VAGLLALFAGPQIAAWYGGLLGRGGNG